MARIRRILTQISLLFFVLLACSFGYVVAAFLWGIQYESTYGEFRRSTQSVKDLAGPDTKWFSLRLSQDLPVRSSKPIEWRLFGKEFMNDSELEVIRRVQKEGEGDEHHTSGNLLRFIRQSPKVSNVRRNRKTGENSVVGRLKSVTDQFQRQLETSWPLNCHPGRQGFGKYERFAKALQDYADFHQKTSPKLKSNQTDQSRVLVWQCSALDYCGGLVDRMKGITYSLLLAIFSRRRLIINWDDRFIQPNLINWKDDVVYDVLKSVDKEAIAKLDNINSSKKQESNSNSKHNEDELYNLAEQDGMVKTDDKDKADYFDAEDEYAFVDSVKMELTSKLDTLSEYPFEFRMFSILGGTGIDNSLDDIIYKLSTVESPRKYVFLSTNLEPCTLKDTYKNGNQKWIMDGLKWVGLYHLSPDDIDKVVGIVMRYLFRLKDSLVEEVERASHTLALSQPYTSLHIRTGFAGSKQLHETIQLPKFVREKERWANMIKCAVETADSFLGSSSPIMLATDSRIIKHMAVTKYGGRFRTLDNTLLHIDKMNKIPHRLRGREMEGVVFTWVDILLLAESHVQVGGTSGYFWAAGQLCRLPSERIINADTCVAGSD